VISITTGGSCGFPLKTCPLNLRHYKDTKGRGMTNFNNFITILNAVYVEITFSVYESTKRTQSI
jgi:hypothetical protein